MKQKKQLVVLAFFLLIAGFIWFVYFNHDKPIVTADAIPPPQSYPPIGVDNPQLHNDAVERARKTEYKGSGRNPFSRELPPPTRPPHPKPDPKQPELPPAPAAPPTPTVSPLPVKFFGYGTVPNSLSRRAFFTDGEDVYIVGEGEVLLNRFRILRIGNASLEYEDITTGLRGTAILEEQAAPPTP
ncbi:MAG: hypothetical protein AUG83_01240 [Acidobacteria bacterium 13_1_20CM_4_57_11]|nr:MAG: hypothetical protein AUG83_01240 [Acidobacteria bacterium 13_1_20CM_4_57_11]